MKARLFIIVSVMLAALSVNAQNRFEKIAEMEGVTSVYVSPKMFSMMNDSNTGDINKETYRVANSLVRKSGSIGPVT